MIGCWFCYMSVSLPCGFVVQINSNGRVMYNSSDWGFVPHPPIHSSHVECRFVPPEEQETCGIGIERVSHLVDHGHVISK